MSYLRGLGIQNFRSISKANLKLGEITVVIGPSDSGKSNLVRALKAWAYNAPGSGFTTEGSKISRVAVAVGKRHKIVFEKNKPGGRHGKTRFVVVEGDGGTPVSFEKVGRAVPDEVLEITKFRPVVVDELKVPIHFAEQAEPWFLLANPPWTSGEVSKVIGRVSGVDALILANRDLINKRNKIGSEARSLRDRADELRGRLEEFEWVDAAAVALAEIEEVSGSLTSSRERLRQAIRHGERFKEAKAALAEAERRAAALRAAEDHISSSSIDGALSVLMEASRILTRVDALKSTLAGAGERKAALRERLDSLVSDLMEAAKDSDLECPLCGGPAHLGCRKALIMQADELRYRNSGGGDGS